MPTPILVAIVTGVFTIVGIILNQWLIAKGGGRSPRSRFSTIEGTYHGVVKEGDCEAAVEFELTTVRRNRLKGKMTVDFAGCKTHPAIRSEFQIHGEFWHEKFLTITYRNVKPASVQVGLVFLLYSEDGQRLEGEFRGNGLISHGYHRCQGSFDVRRRG